MAFRALADRPPPRDSFPTRPSPEPSPKRPLSARGCLDSSNSAFLTCHDFAEFASGGPLVSNPSASMSLVLPPSSRGLVHRRYSELYCTHNPSMNRSGSSQGRTIPLPSWMGHTLIFDARESSSGGSAVMARPSQRMRPTTVSLPSLNSRTSTVCMGSLPIGSPVKPPEKVAPCGVVGIYHGDANTKFLVDGANAQAETPDAEHPSFNWNTFCVLDGSHWSLPG